MVYILLSSECRLNNVAEVPAELYSRVHSHYQTAPAELRHGALEDDESDNEHCDRTYQSPPIFAHTTQHNVHNADDNDSFDSLQYDRLALYSIFVNAVAPPSKVHTTKTVSQLLSCSVAQLRDLLLAAFELHARTKRIKGIARLSDMVNLFLLVPHT